MTMTVQPTFSIDDQTERISTGLETIMNSVASLRQENIRLMMIRDAAQIHLLQLQHDVARIKALSKKLRAQYDQMRVTNVPNPLSIPAVPPKSPGQTPGNDAFNLISLPYDIEPAQFKSLMKLKYAIKTDSVVCTASFNGNGEYFAFSDGRNVFLIKTYDGSVAATLEIPGATADFNVRALAISSDSSYLAIGGPSNNILLYSIPEQRLVKSFEEHTNVVSALIFINESHTLVSGCFDGILCVWDLDSMTLAKRFEHPSPDGKQKNEMIVALTKDAEESFVGIGFMSGAVGIRDTSFTSNNSFTAHSEMMFDVTTSPLDCAIATSSHDNKTKIWALRHVASCKNTLTGHEDCVLTACFSPLAPLVFTGSKDESIKCWNYKSGELQCTLRCNTNTVFKVVHHPSEKLFVSCSGDQTISLWEYSM